MTCTDRRAEKHIRSQCCGMRFTTFVNKTHFACLSHPTSFSLPPKISARCDLAPLPNIPNPLNHSQFLAVSEASLFLRKLFRRNSTSFWHVMFGRCLRSKMFSSVCVVVACKSTLPRSTPCCTVLRFRLCMLFFSNQFSNFESVKFCLSLQDLLKNVFVSN